MRLASVSGIVAVVVLVMVVSGDEKIAQAPVHLAPEPMQNYNISELQSENVSRKKLAQRTLFELRIVLPKNALNISEVVI